MTSRPTSAELVEVKGAQGIRLVGERWAVPPGVPMQGCALLLHGGGQTRHSWAATGARLAGEGWTAVAMDARGHGASEWGTEYGGYRIDRLIEDLQAVVAWLGEPPVVLGASMGGMTALMAEGENPGLLRAMVLVDITPSIEPAGAERIEEFMVSGIAGFDSLEDAAVAVTAYRTHRAQPATANGLRRNLRQGSDGRWYWHWDPAFMTGDPLESPRRIPRERRRTAAARVRVPTLLVRGTQSDIVSPAGAQELLELVPRSRYVEVPQAGHMVVGDDNDVFTGEVQRFLANLPLLTVRATSGSATREP